MDSKEGSTAKVGAYGMGLKAYWSQFDGIKERLEGYRRHVEVHLFRVHRGGLAVGWYAWVAEVRPGYEEEYGRRHDEI